MLDYFSSVNKCIFLYPLQGSDCHDNKNKDDVVLLPFNMSFINQAGSLWKTLPYVHLLFTDWSLCYQNASARLVMKILVTAGMKMFLRAVPF